MHSIVEYVGSTKGGHCGYCKSEDSSKSAVGMMAYSLSVQHYNALLDRGLRRSGRYLYKPDIMETCCPQYTIRLDTNKFVLSRTQKRVLRRMNDFLMYDHRPKKAIRGCDTRKKNTEPSEHRSEKIAPRLDEISKRDDGRSKKTNKNEDIKFVDEENGDNNGVVGKGVDKRDHGKKKKTIRRERAFARMRSKGINIEEVIKRRAAKEEARRRTLESFILPYDASKFEHHLQVRLVKVGSNEFNEIADESFEVFLKYQTIIHNDTDRSRRSYENFLVNSPLFDSDQSEENRNKSVQLGSYHQLYILDGHIIAVGVLDILPRCMSAKYFYYDPDYTFLSMGTYAALREIAFTRQLAKERPELHYYYMGYYIESCPKMRYKGKFRPSELLCDRSFTWVPLDECVKQMKVKGEHVEAFAPHKPPAEQIDVGSVRCLYQKCSMPYSVFLLHGNPTGTEDFMKEYAQTVGPVAKEILLYRD